MTEVITAQALRWRNVKNPLWPVYREYTDPVMARPQRISWNVMFARTCCELYRGLDMADPAMRRLLANEEKWWSVASRWVRDSEEVT